MQECQEALKAGFRAHIIAWLRRVTKAPSALNSRKLPVCWVYSGTIHSIEVNQALWDMVQSVRKDGGSAVILTPDDMGVPKASNKLAKMMCNQLSDVSLPPGSHYTLQHVAAKCAKNMRKACNSGPTFHLWMIIRPSFARPTMLAACIPVAGCRSLRIALGSKQGAWLQRRCCPAGRPVPCDITAYRLQIKFPRKPSHFLPRHTSHEPQFLSIHI